jgi:hypothetical protein
MTPWLLWFVIKPTGKLALQGPPRPISNRAGTRTGPEGENGMDILLGILLVLFGLVITFFGIPVFFATLPLLGLIFGFFVGAAGVEAVFGDGFLSTVTGWIAGIVVGVLFAVLSWFWWYAGVLIAAGAFGTALGTGFMEAIGSDREWLIFIAGLIGLAVAIGLTLVLDLPVYIVIFSTAFAGATVLVTGILLVFNQVNYEELGYGTAVAIIEESWFWVMVWAAVAVIGLTAQLLMKSAVQVPEERWTTAQHAAA